MLRVNKLSRVAVAKAPRRRRSSHHPCSSRSSRSLPPVRPRSLRKKDKEAKKEGCLRRRSSRSLCRRCRSHPSPWSRWSCRKPLLPCRRVLGSKMCRRHVEEEKAEEENGKDGRKLLRRVPLWHEESRVEGVVVVVDVLCANPHCLFRNEDTWFKQALSRGPGRLCGSSACLTHNRCSLAVLPPRLTTAIRRRYVLKDPSVDGHGP